MTRISYSSKELYLASVLYDSIEDNNISAINTILVEKKGNPNVLVPRKGISPFHLAIGCDDSKYAFEVTKLLLQYGGNPNVRSIDGLTPVHIASAWGRLDILKTLLNCGGDPYLKDRNYMTPIDYAYDQNQNEIANFFKENYPAVDLSGITIEEEEENIFCDFILDKVLVNSGNITGEYKIDSSYHTMEKSNLTDLPLEDTKQFVLNWIDTVEPTNENLDSKIDDFNVSDEHNTAMNHPNVTQRRKQRPRLSSFIENSYINDTSKVNCCYSRESGINTLPMSSFNSLRENPCMSFVDFERSASKESNDKQKDTSSDYFTCTDVSECNILNMNLQEGDLSNLSIISKDISGSSNSLMTNDCSVRNDNLCRQSVAGSNMDKTFVSVSEVYKYLDPQEGVVLYEKRLLVTPNNVLDESITSAVSSQSSAVSSLLPTNFDYDTDTLRRELLLKGIEPGPITKTTKRIYLKKLYKVRKTPNVVVDIVPNDTTSRVYSRELEKTLKNTNWETDLASCRDLDLIVSNEFGNPDPSRKWREGVNKSSFNYLLLDPRITQNLPCRLDSLSKEQAWEVFLQSIFYVGKGKRSRPYSHLYEALNIWNCGSRKSKNAKLQTILDIWSQDMGVVCLHIFQNVIPVEAYTREAAMISAVRLENLKNAKSGDFYGKSSTWSSSEKCKFGVFLLYRAMNIFLQEGERQLSPKDID